MGEYEPDDFRNVTLRTSAAPGEPPRTGPREGAARAEAQAGKKNRGTDGDQPPSSQSQDQGQQSQALGGKSQSQTQPG